MDLLDDHIHTGVNFYATTQEIVREWQAMGEDTLEFEAAKKELAEEREKFNSEKKGLLWRVADAEDKLAKEKQFNADRQKEWETACKRTNREIKAAHDEIVKLKDEHEQAISLYKKERTNTSNALQSWKRLLLRRLRRAKPLRFWLKRLTLIASGYLRTTFPWYIADRIVKSDELAKYMFELGEAAYDSGRKEGYGEGRAAVVANEKVDHFDLYKTDCLARYASKRQEYEFLEFAIVKAVGKLSRKTNAVETLKKALGEQDVETGDAGTSHQV
ncbi:hypothetical protein Hanom_Chr12g01129881 [Helianthus anomalus]